MKKYIVNFFANYHNNERDSYGSEIELMIDHCVGEYEHTEEGIAEATKDIESYIDGLVNMLPKYNSAYKYSVIFNLETFNGETEEFEGADATMTYTLDENLKLIEKDNKFIF